LEELFYIADRASIDNATMLISQFGDHAVIEAAQRADRYRGLGNAIRFCQWRQIERVISVLSQECSVGTVH
jgi:hypothetical protein